LRPLAAERGQTFAVPHTRAQASCEIARLKAYRPSTRSETTRDRREVRRDLSTGDTLSPPAHEIGAYGGSARWAGHADVHR
jgi:hypothetical protein